MRYDCIRKEDISGIASCVFTKNGQGEENAFNENVVKIKQLKSLIQAIKSHSGSESAKSLFIFPHRVLPDLSVRVREVLPVCQSPH